MARAQSKVLSAAETKVANGEKKIALAAAKAALKEANGALKAYEKETAGKTKELTKAVTVAQKAYDKLAPSPAA